MLSTDLTEAEDLLKGAVGFAKAAGDRRRLARIIWVQGQTSLRADMRDRALQRLQLARVNLCYAPLHAHFIRRCFET
jgi:hypothetical protein